MRCASGETAPLAPLAGCRILRLGQHYAERGDGGSSAFQNRAIQNHQASLGTLLLGSGWHRTKKATVALKKSDLYSSIWASCDELRGGMDSILSPIAGSMMQELLTGRTRLV